MQFTMVSNANCESVCEALRTRFAGQARNPVNLHTEFIAQAGQTKHLREEQPVEQANLVIGFRTGAKAINSNHYAMRVMDDMFGGGVYSKLFVNVREKMSLCYRIRSYFLRHKGILLVRAGIDTDQFEKARDAIFDMLSKMQAGEFTDDDLAVSKRALCDSYSTTADLPESLARWYGSSLVSGEFITPEDACAGVNTVSREQVITAAKQVTLDTVYLLAAKKSEEAADA